MRDEPAIKSDTFGADLANALLLRPVYRAPAPKPKVNPRQSHPDYPNGSLVLLNSPMRPCWTGKLGVVEAYWPIASAGPVFTVTVQGYEDGPVYFDIRELTVVLKAG